MKKYVVELTEEVELFYSQIAKAAGLPIEQVLSDILFRTAGELSLNALEERSNFNPMGKM